MANLFMREADQFGKPIKLLPSLFDDIDDRTDIITEKLCNLVEEVEKVIDKDYIVTPISVTQIVKDSGWRLVHRDNQGRPALILWTWLGGSAKPAVVNEHGNSFPGNRPNDSYLWFMSPQDVVRYRAMNAVHNAKLRTAFLLAEVEQTIRRVKDAGKLAAEVGKTEQEVKAIAEAEAKFPKPPLYTFDLEWRGPDYTRQGWSPTGRLVFGETNDVFGIPQPSFFVGVREGQSVFVDYYKTEAAAADFASLEKRLTAQYARTFRDILCGKKQAVTNTVEPKKEPLPTLGDILSKALAEQSLAEYYKKRWPTLDEKLAQNAPKVESKKEPLILNVKKALASFDIEQHSIAYDGKGLYTIRGGKRQPFAFGFDTVAAITKTFADECGLGVVKVYSSSSKWSSDTSITIEAVAKS